WATAAVGRWGEVAVQGGSYAAPRLQTAVHSRTADGRDFCTHFDRGHPLWQLGDDFRAEHSVPDYRREHRAADDSGRDFTRGVRGGPRRLVVEQQIFSAGRAPSHRADGQL